ncbi:MAG: pseudouridine synthase [Pseudomonadales bacterium]|nr:pseudouridine synthase [Pseudomonadales bacterium]
MQHDLILFHKPFGVLCQFTGAPPTLADHIDLHGFYPAGRLDKDSEGLLLLTNSGVLQARITEPTQKMANTYWVQVEGECQAKAVKALQDGVILKDGLTRPAKVKIIAPDLPPRTPPIRSRKNQSTSWLEITLTEGRNRQVRRMTAHVGHPTLRLFRRRIGPWTIDALPPGKWVQNRINLPGPAVQVRHPKRSSSSGRRT